MKTITRYPQPYEYGAYFNTYISKVETGDILQTLADARVSTLEFFKNLPKEKWNYRYAPGKWSIKEILQHLIDCERVFAYRALRIARNDKTALPGFDENLFADHCHANDRTPASLLAEYKAVRTATLHLFKSFKEEDYDRLGTMSNNPASPLAIAYIIAGHERHHVGVIKERYLRV
jgi:uncharacterized damage-inducible protein DinB